MKIPVDKLNELVPEQVNGSHTEITEEFVFANRESAQEQFGLARQRLTNVNEWHKVCDGMSAEFQLMDREGKREVDELILHGYIRINIPGPSLEEGEGYDWVRIEEIVDRNYEANDETFFGFRVRPVKNPTSTDPKPSHMFTETATSCFILYRSGVQVVAAQIGNNEMPNTGIHNLKDKIRNTLVALGAMVGFSEKQWSNLMRGIMCQS